MGHVDAATARNFKGEIENVDSAGHRLPATLVAASNYRFLVPVRIAVSRSPFPRDETRRNRISCRQRASSRSVSFVKPRCSIRDVPHCFISSLSSSRWKKRGLQFCCARRHTLDLYLLSSRSQFAEIVSSNVSRSPSLFDKEVACKYQCTGIETIAIDFA